MKKSQESKALNFFLVIILGSLLLTKACDSFSNLILHEKNHEREESKDIAPAPIAKKQNDSSTYKVTSGTTNVESFKTTNTNTDTFSVIVSSVDKNTTEKVTDCPSYMNKYQDTLSVDENDLNQSLLCRGDTSDKAKLECIAFARQYAASQNLSFQTNIKTNIINPEQSIQTDSSQTPNL